MMLTTELKSALAGNACDAALATLYSPAAVEAQKARYLRVAETFERLYGAGRAVGVFSAPGRTEVCGNHTDHNHGKVLAAGVNLDAIAVAGRNDVNIVRIKSEGYRMDVTELSDLRVHDNETGHSASLVRGVCAAFRARGYNVGGFDAATASNVLSGSGLSSSAAFEVLIGTMLNHLYNDGKVDPVEIAQIAQYAENVYFGKPCGLMDQMACSVGGFVEIDFRDPAAPFIEKVPFDFAACGHALCIVDTGGTHADLTDDYAAVRREMEAAAQVFGKSVLREVEPADFKAQIPAVRKAAGDRAVLRGLHFFRENERVERQAAALKAGDFDAFKQLVIESGYSSYMYNQNVFTPKAPTSQPVSVALALCAELLAGKGAWRVHGGGFAGTIQAFVPLELQDAFKAEMTAVFGEKACHVLQIRPVGGTAVL
ncbi:MAG: galactokinase [Clostridia bacterium]|nr:galactokinase [Clostridia bacterium]